MSERLINHLKIITLMISILPLINCSPKLVVLSGEREIKLIESQSDCVVGNYQMTPSYWHETLTLMNELTAECRADTNSN